MSSKFNYDDIFFRNLTACVLATLEDKVSWINRFTQGDVEVTVPFYYSLLGDERFLLDSFTDDIVSNSRFVELNTDQIPRGHITLTSFEVKSDEFTNPNIWLKTIVENETEIRSALAKVRAIPIKAQYSLTILLNNEIDIFKCSESILNTIWLYKYMYFQHNFMHIDAMMFIPDSNQIKIEREQSLNGDTSVNLTLDFEVHTYYPAYNAENTIQPKRSKWINNIITSNSNKSNGDNLDPGGIK